MSQIMGVSADTAQKALKTGPKYHGHRSLKLLKKNIRNRRKAQPIKNRCFSGKRKGPPLE